MLKFLIVVYLIDYYKITALSIYRNLCFIERSRNFYRAQIVTYYEFQNRESVDD